MEEIKALPGTLGLRGGPPGPVPGPHPRLQVRTEETLRAPPAPGGRREGDGRHPLGPQGSSRPRVTSPRFFELPPSTPSPPERLNTRAASKVAEPPAGDNPRGRTHKRDGRRHQRGQPSASGGKQATTPEKFMDISYDKHEGLCIPCSRSHVFYGSACL